MTTLSLQPLPTTTPTTTRPDLTSPPFEYALSAPYVLSAVDEMITALETVEDDQLPELLHDIRLTLGAWQVITTDDGETRRILASPVTAQTNEQVRPLLARLKHFVQTAGMWESRRFTTYKLYVSSMFDLPFHFNVSADAYADIQAGDPDLRKNATALFAALVGIHMTLEKNLELGCTDFGIFQSPGAILAKNVLTDWLNDYGDTGRDISRRLETASLLDLIAGATITTNN